MFRVLCENNNGLMSHLGVEDRALKDLPELMASVIKNSGLHALSAALENRIHFSRYDAENNIVTEGILDGVELSFDGKVTGYFSRYVNYYFFTAGSDNHPVFRKVFRDESRPMVKDVTLTDYIENDDVRHLVDSFLAGPSRQFLQLIASEGVKCQYSINTIVNPLNKSKVDVVTQRGKYKLPKSVGRYPFVYGLFLREASKIYSNDDMAFFYDKEKAKQFCDSIIYGGFSLKGMMIHGSQLLLWPNVDINVIASYLDACKANSEHPNIRIRNEETMVDNLAKIEVRNTKPIDMDVDPVYEKLEKFLGGKYHLLRNTSEMVYEGLRQKNCVHTYVDAVNRHDCGIFNYDENNKHYTIEVSHTKDSGYVCRQFYGFANRYSEECERLNTIFKQELMLANAS